MSLQSVILSLLSGIPDTAVRTDIASTIYFLRDAFLSGRISLDTLKSELTSIVSTILDITHPELLPDEKKKKVSMLVDQLVKAIQMDTLRLRTLSRFSQFGRSESFPM